MLEISALAGGRRRLSLRSGEIKRRWRGRGRGRGGGGCGRNVKLVDQGLMRTQAYGVNFWVQGLEFGVKG